MDRTRRLSSFGLLYGRKVYNYGAMNWKSPKCLEHRSCCGDLEDPAESSAGYEGLACGVLKRNTDFLKAVFSYFILESAMKPLLSLAEISFLGLKSWL